MSKWYFRENVRKLSKNAIGKFIRYTLTMRIVYCAAYISYKSENCFDYFLRSIFFVLSLLSSHLETVMLISTSTLIDVKTNNFSLRHCRCHFVYLLIITIIMETWFSLFFFKLLYCAERDRFLAFRLEIVLPPQTVQGTWEKKKMRQHSMIPKEH